MPFLILGIPIAVIGFLLLRRGLRKGSRETRNGAAAMLLGGLLMIILGTLLLITNRV